MCAGEAKSTLTHQVRRRHSRAPAPSDNPQFNPVTNRVSTLRTVRRRGLPIDGVGTL
jgi:hypothetical protein